MSVNAIVEMRFNPESAARVPGILREVLTDTRKFPGCERVDVMFPGDDDCHAFIIETWESAAADTAYRDWRATPEGAATIMGEILAAPPTVYLGVFSADI